jgi:hypothetical protein
MRIYWWVSRIYWVGVPNLPECDLESTGGCPESTESTTGWVSRIYYRESTTESAPRIYSESTLSRIYWGSYSSHPLTLALKTQFTLQACL